MGIVRIAAIGACLACASCWAYRAGDLSARQRRWASTRVVGCLDVATEIVRDPHVDDAHPVVDVQFGNRCEDGVTVDLSRLRVSARWADGAHAELQAYDPRHEIEPKLLMPQGTGHEAIEFDPPSERKDAPTRVCIDVSRIDDGDRPVAETCFTRFEDGMLPEGGET